jgi:hypothetical protein
MGILDDAMIELQKGLIDQAGTEEKKKNGKIFN